MKSNLLGFLTIFFIWIIFSFPYFFRNKIPFSTNYQVTFFAPWSAYQQFASPVKNAAMPDVIGQMYPWRNLTISTWKIGQIPFWNPYSFAGTPHLANYQSAVLSITNLLFFVLPFTDGWSMSVLLQPLLAGIFMYLFTRKFLNSYASIVSSVSFMFCGFLVTWMGYATLGYAVLYLPLALFALESFFQEGKSRFLVLLAVTIPLSFFSGHFQISIYFLIGVISYLIYKSISSKDKKKIITTFLVMFFSLFLILPQVLPSLEFYQQSLRQGIFQAVEVIPWSYLPTLFAPDFYGNPVTRNDWLGHYAEWNGFIGTIALFLAFLSLKKKNGRVIFFWLLGLLALLLTLPTPIGDLIVFLKIPVISTSAVSRIIVLFSFSLAILSGFGYEQLEIFIKKRDWKFIFSWAVLCAVILLSLWLVVFTKVFLPIDKIATAKSNLYLPTTLFVFLILIIVIAFFAPKRFTKIILFSIIILTIFDSYRFAQKWQSFDPRNLLTPNVGVTEEFKKIQGYERAVGNYGAEVSVFYKLPSLEGYDALYPKREGEFIASLSDGKFQESARSVVNFPRSGKYTPLGVNLLNVAYIVHKVGDTGKVWTFPYWLYPMEQFSLIFNDGNYQIFRNNSAFPHVFLVNKYKVVKNSQDILDNMFSKNTDLKKTVFVEEDPKTTDLGIGEAKIISYTPDKVIIHTISSKKSLLFLSDTYYPGWTAYVDGKLTKIYRADFAFRTIVVPSGYHTIIFSYFPNSFMLGLILFVIGVMSIILITFTI